MYEKYAPCKCESNYCFMDTINSVNSVITIEISRDFVV